MSVTDNRPRHRATDHPPEALALVVRLRDELRSAGVRHCHWKSNDMLAKSLDGRNDLDLLVHPEDVQAFLEVLGRLRFRRGLAPGGRDHPGVWHAYSLDEATGTLVHVHAHARLVLGDDATKNYRLPLEAAYVESVREQEPLPVPAAEFELALFVVRMILKHSTWDAVAMGNGTLGDNERRELAWLLERADHDGVRDIVTRHLPAVGALWDECLAALVDDPGVVRRIRLGRRLMAALAPYGRRRRSVDTAVRIGKRGRWAWSAWVLRRRNRKRLDGPGFTIGLVGGDGAGKTTAVDATCAWLGSTFVVHRTHLGRPRPSFLTLALKGPMFVARRAGALSGVTTDPRTATEADVPGVAGALWHVLTARDRAREYRRLRRAADSGAMVVSDRWPLPCLGSMDCPRVSWVLDLPSPPGGIVGAMARWERRLYAGIAPPDCLVVLRLDPEEAIRRRPEDPPDYLRRRNGEVFDADWSALGAVVVDAAQPPEAVLAAIRNAVWDLL